MSHPNNTPKTNGEVHYSYSATIVKAELHTRIKRSHCTKSLKIHKFHVSCLNG